MEGEKGRHSIENGMNFRKRDGGRNAVEKQYTHNLPQGNNLASTIGQSLQQYMSMHRNKVFHSRQNNAHQKTTTQQQRLR